FWRRPAASPNRDARRPEVLARCLATHARLALDAPQRPAELAQCFYLLSLLVAQDVAHPRRRTTCSTTSSTSRERPSVAGFQVITSGRFSVITEGSEKNGEA